MQHEGHKQTIVPTRYGWFFPADETKPESISALLIFAGALIFVLFLGFGKIFITLGAILICLGLLLQLILQGPKTFLLKRTPWLALLLFLTFAWFGARSCWGVDPEAGFSGFKTSLYKGLTFFVAGMELARRPRYFKVLFWAFLLGAVAHGVNGMWQYVTGFDFIKGYPIMSGRLTSAFSTYRVGNLIAMYLAVLLALPWFLPPSWNKLQKGIVFLLLLAAPFFLLVFAQARSGYLCFASAGVAVLLLQQGFKVKYLLAVGAVVFLLLCFGPQRVSMDAALKDVRLSTVWPGALLLFEQHPIIGVGVNGYTAGLAELGVKALVNHPHNIYLQLLAETGLVGFFLYLSVVFGIAIQGWKVLRERAAAGLKDKEQAFAASCWAVCVGYLCMGISAHDLLRDWWFALAMLLFGFVAGYCAVQKIKTQVQGRA